MGAEIDAAVMGGKIALYLVLLIRNVALVTLQLQNGAN
jgi:hypothetical protein